ncbi:N-6 DNA methylase [Aliarcobacter butzleri]|uniref:type I restriction-modification system subunit M n=1 Tax=Aliarcobacter butzleri TaxID=28197 RepID=UPI003AF34651
MAKEKVSKNQKSMEETLWESANKLRGSVESSEYKHIVLGLIFLKFVSDTFEERREKLLEEGKEAFIDMVEFYTMENVFYLPTESRWSYIKQNAKQDDIALKIDTALATIEKNNPSLKGALPDNYFSRLNLDVSKLSSLIDTINNINTIEDKGHDVVGRVYEYFLGEFALAEGKLGGQFYTPKSIVNLLANMIEPYKGKIYDPACGSGGMFIQSLKFIEAHKGNKKDISIYGQEFTATTYKLAKMNLAIRGISANLGAVPADTFFKDQHPDLKADYIMANPPFNQKEWRGVNELLDDPRWAGYSVPSTSNANYAWILHMLSKLSENGIAGFVLAKGSLTSNSSNEGEIRKQLIENNLVDCIVNLPAKLFFNTQIPACLWFIKKNRTTKDILFIDARNLGHLINRKNKDFSPEDIEQVASTYHNWKLIGSGTSVPQNSKYEDIKGFCKSASLEEVRELNYVLTPGRYVGLEENEDEFDFKERFESLQNELMKQMKEEQSLNDRILANLSKISLVAVDE